MKQELIYAVENFKNEQKISNFILQLTNDGIYDLFAILERSNDETQELWKTVYNKTFKISLR